MRRTLLRGILIASITALAVIACGDSSNESDGASPNDPNGEGGPNAEGGGPGDPTGDAAFSDGAPPTSCDAFGHYGAPGKTFTLPGPNAGGLLSYNDIQQSFPAVDWMTIDRLYVPAGKYKSFLIGNLPKRDPVHPLVITNLGGQVEVGPNDPGGNFIWSITGGSNWILTGRYDPESKTGDVGFPGHRCGAYAQSRGKYGFISDDAYAKGQYLHMGLAVTAATSFEIEYLEVTRSGFAGIRLINERAAADPAMPMENVRVHDNYIHDTDGEGFYFGWTGTPPSNLFPKLAIYNNRIVRSGNESLQIQDLGEGSEVHHNVFAWGSLHWRDNGLGKYQDSNSQVLTREGTIKIHHNAFIGGSSTLLSFFTSPEPGDGERHVTFSDNYFADTLSLAGYINGTAAAASTFAFERNVFRGLTFGYQKLDPAATAPDALFGRNPPVMGAITFTDNTWEGDKKLFSFLAGPNGTSGSVTATGNKNAAVAKYAFTSSDDFDADPTRHLEAWAPAATVQAGSPPITYQPGDRVMSDAQLYECLVASTNELPSTHPAAWKKLPLPVDDVRAAAGSPYAAIGVH